MSENLTPQCPDCENLPDEMPDLDRRDFLRAVGSGAALVTVAALPAVPARAALPAVPARAEDKPAPRPAKPAEDLIRELYSSLSDEQKNVIVMPWDHGAIPGKRRATRLRMYNSPIGKRIGDVYTRPQQEVVERILRAICSDDEGFRRISRNGNYDQGGGFPSCGANIFGDPTGGQKFAWVFTGHHLTARCDGNSEEGAAFGGPMFYGHSPNGYSERNVFFYQTKSVLSVYQALSGKQQEQAVVTGNPGEGESSIRFRARGEAKPGIPFSELTQDQKALVEKVMRDILLPYRKEDADEVMDIVKANGGMEKIHLAFYQDARMNDNKKWHFWRLEGPGFVWNYRVLPHVHTYVNISSKV
jgi:hypothetical protein